MSRLDDLRRRQVKTLWRDFGDEFGPEVRTQWVQWSGICSTKGDNIKAPEERLAYAMLEALSFDWWGPKFPSYPKFPSRDEVVEILAVHKKQIHAMSLPAPSTLMALAGRLEFLR